MLTEVGTLMKSTVSKTAYREPLFTPYIVSEWLQFPEAAQRSWLAEKQVRTSDPFRTLIQMHGYGKFPQSAMEMEKIIAESRDNISVGSLSNESDLRQSIASKYVGAVRNFSEAETRPYDQAYMFPKHYPYERAFWRSLGSEKSELQMTGLIDGQEIPFAKMYQEKYEKGWRLPTDPKTLEIAQTRLDRLYQEILASRAEAQTPALLAHHVELAGEGEWLNAQLWRYKVGSAGISQIEARTWLESVGADSGRFKIGG